MPGTGLGAGTTLVTDTVSVNPSELPFYQERSQSKE